MKKKKILVLVYMSLLISMNVVLSHIVPVIQIDTLRVSFGFLPVSFASMLFGPLMGGIGAALGDVIGMIIAPKGAYFPGFTLNAMLTGMIYGFFLYRKPKTVMRISVAVICIALFIHIGLNTYWLTIILGKGYLAILPARIIKNVAMAPVEVVLIKLMWKYAGERIENSYMELAANRPSVF